MASVGQIPIRRAQLVSPFGVGALNVGPDGTSVITAGLDHWFERAGQADLPPADVEEFKLAEWRLEAELGVSHFRLPPDFRVPMGAKVPNVNLRTPVLRFPQFHLCNYCRTLRPVPLTSRERVRCLTCQPENGKKAPLLTQVRFIVLCEAGHVGDFPWREWVHRAGEVSCTKELRLLNQGAAGLASTKVECACGVARSLNGVTEARTLPSGATSSMLTQSLDASGTPFYCRGTRPWLGNEASEQCGMPVRASLRGASNAYFAMVRSAILLPRESSLAPPALLEKLQLPPLCTLVKLLRSLGSEPTPQNLRTQHPALLAEYSDEELRAALGDSQTAESEAQTAGDEVQFRHQEFQVLTRQVKSGPLSVRRADQSSYQGLPESVAGVSLIESLTETRVFAGFTRLDASRYPTPEERRKQIWHEPPPPSEDWLPAYVVKGEGFLVEFDTSRIRQWEQSDGVMARTKVLVDRYSRLSGRSTVIPKPITARFVLLHTFAHVLINELTFESGYSTAALRERLYSSSSPATDMAAVLIYTAAGDSEGTLGGLVDKGRPGHLEALVATAIDKARWCSADPVCMELGTTVGQGPDGCNLAACHNCGLLPETACEEFNRFLDRGLLIGTDGLRGFFELT